MPSNARGKHICVYIYIYTYVCMYVHTCVHILELRVQLCVPAVGRTFASDFWQYFGTRSLHTLSITCISKGCQDLLLDPYQIFIRIYLCTYRIYGGNSIRNLPGGKTNIDASHKFRSNTYEISAVYRSDRHWWPGVSARLLASE